MRLQSEHGLASTAVAEESLAASATVRLVELRAQSEMVDAAARALYPKAKASTLNRQLFGPMVAIMRSAVRAKLPGAYVPIWERRDEDRPQIHPADDAHIDALLPYLDDGLMRLIWLMSFTGLRTGEALRVDQEGIRDGYAVVGKTKNGDPRMVPLPKGWEYPSGGWGYTTTQGVGKAL